MGEVFTVVATSFTLAPGQGTVQTRAGHRVTHSVSTASHPSPGPFLEKDFPGWSLAGPVRRATGHTVRISSSRAAPQREAPSPTLPGEATEETFKRVLVNKANLPFSSPFSALGR